MNRWLFAARNVLDKLKKVIGSREVFKSYLNTYLLSYFESVEPDIYIISYPKSGKTWLRVMFQNYLELLGEPPQHCHNHFLMRLANNKTVKFDHEQSDWVPTPKRLGNLTFDSARFSDKNVILLLRDPRDILVSSWYHLTYREKIYQDTISAFIRDDLVGVHKIIAFFNMWIENSNIPKDFLLLTYEDMHRDISSGFKSALKHIGIRVDNDLVQKAIEETSFKKMKQMEAKGTLKEPWMKPGDNNQTNSMKVRKGKVGSYREELSEEDVEFLDQAIRENLSSKLSYS